MTRSHRYTAIAVTLHWIIAFMIVGLILVGWQMGDMEPGAPGQEQLYQMHKSFGISLLILTVARIAWRVLNPPPPLPAEMKGWERTASHAVHFGFYALMLAMPLSGWLYVSTAYDFDVPTVLFGVVSWPDLPGVGFLANPAGHGAVEFVHSKLAWVAIGLLVLHVAGALKHDLFDEEGVLHRMLPGLFGPSAGPARAPRGGLIAFGTAAAMFVAIAAIPVMAQGRSDGPPPAAPLASPSATASGASAPAWQVDAAREPIRFSGTHEGNAYTGGFPDWTASIAFDPDNPGAGAATVTVDLTSVTTNKKLYTDSLKAPEWFHVGDHPVATVRIDGFAAGDGADTYTADATLSLKDREQTVPLTAEIVIDGETAQVSGTAEFSRAALDLGMSSDPGADWVGDEVTVTFAFTASRSAEN